VLDPKLVVDIANEIRPGTEPQIEKEWHVVRAIGVVAAMEPGVAVPVFSGGTSLSVGWGIIKRFSEDIDFKVAMPEAATKSATERGRRAYRRDVITAMTGAGFELVGEPRRGNDHRFFSADFSYPARFTVGAEVRPHLQLEMTFERSALSPVARPIQSLVSRMQGQPPEVAAFPCVDPIETAADKLSALAWRVCVRDRGGPKDDPRIVRHLHDLAALEPHAAASPAFGRLLHEVGLADTGRGRGRAPAGIADRLSTMLERLATDPVWRDEYDTFVGNATFAGAGEAISYDEAP
jgi:hypothetical protein